jgi:hypothetical protein
MPAMTGPDAYLAVLVARAQEVLGPNLFGAYAAGSLALGAFDPQRSDIDVALVTLEPVSEAAKRDLVAALRHEALAVPARGLELVVYTGAVAGSGTPDPAFEVELNTGPGMRFRATYRPEDRPVADGLFWYGLDRSLLSQSHGALLGPSASQVFADLTPEDLRFLLVDALTWWLGRPGEPVDAVLGACRSVVRVRDGGWLSKVAAGQQLLETGYQPAAAVKAAVAARLGQGPPPSRQAARAFQRALRDEIRRT